MTTFGTLNTRSWLISAAILAFIAGAATFLAIGRGGGSRGGRGGEINPTLRAESQFRIDRSEALAAIRQGHFKKALGFYRTLAVGAWEADDCLGLGETLIEKDRLVLGGAALEAAHRINPEHVASVRALDALRGRIALATGRERSTLHEAASRHELLREIPNGPALAILVLGLVGYSNELDQEDDFLDRLNSHHRSKLRGVTSPDEAVMLIARLLLETGRSIETADLLSPLVANPPTENTDSRPDIVLREAAWLLSRSALQADEQEQADMMLAIAGDFGTTNGAFPEPAPFVGSRRCGDCHPRIYREQQGASGHAQTLRFGEDLKAVPLPQGPIPDPVISGVSHGFKRKGNAEIEIESRTENRVFRAIVDYAVGSGRHGITMIARDEEGVDRELRVSYFGRDGGWGLTKGIDFAPQDAGDHIGIGLGKKSLDHCLSCHTTWFRSVARGVSSTGRPERADRGIGCERCHGPGLNHVKSVESGYAELAIALGSRTSSQARLKSCVECHAADGSIEPSDPEFTRAQGTTFLFSRCYTASKDRFSCTTCHDPHRAVNTESKRYELKCLACHDGKKTLEPDLPDRSTKGHATREARICPVNAKANCISCHMPTVEDPTRRSRFTDHHIRVHRDLGSARE